ncbi:hypothetical protein H8D57_01940, partial [bacterium]|nr:hypothetical protein [bacterium]
WKHYWSNKPGGISLWMDSNRTLWLWADSELNYYRSDIKQWFEFHDRAFNNITAMGEKGSFLYLRESINSNDEETSKFYTINAHSGIVIDESDYPPDNMIWVEINPPKNLPHFNIENNDYWFDNEKGILEDRNHRSFKITNSYNDEHYKKRYYCIPGLGIGIGHINGLELEIIQPGLAGSDVKSIALDKGGFIWAGGNNGTNCGINIFDREGNEWNHYESDFTFGMGSHKIRDIKTTRDKIIFCTDEGLTTLDLLNGQWKTLYRIDGLYTDNLFACAIAGDQLFAGGGDGISRISLSSGSASKVKDKKLQDLHTTDMISDGDTVWVSSLNGVFKWSEEKWERIGSDQRVSGDEGAECLTLSDDYLLIGEHYGLSEYNRKTGEWNNYHSNRFLSGSRANCLATNDSLIWVGTDSGLIAFHRTKNSWVRYGKGFGFPSDKIQDIKLEADTLWVGTPEGLTRFVWNRPERDGF